nr:MAG TPA: hypothetical protein [Caudoviricetes sp.]
MNRYAFVEKSSSDASSERRISGIKKPPCGRFTRHCLSLILLA